MTGQSGGVQDAAVRIAESAFDAYNPTGGEDVMSALTPTILDLPMDIARNKSWSGGLIKPDWLKGLPASEQKFANTGESTTGKIAIKTTDTLAKAGIQVSPNDLLYAYNSLIGGVGKAASRTVNTVTAIAKGEPLVAKEVPFANRFFKTASEEQVQKSLLYKGQANFIKSLQKYQTGSDEQKEAIKGHLRGLGSDQERQSILFKLRDQGFDTKGISYSGKKLGVANVPLKSDKVRLQQTPDQPQNIVDKIALAAQGMTKDPATTIKAIFTQEELRKIEGNAVILKRQEFLNKANDPNLQRDHIIPLGLGGDNSESNLMYVPKDWHTAKTKNDNRLIRELQSGKITRQEAQKQVKAWIEANPHETYIMERPVTGTQVNTGSAYQQAKQKKVAEKEAWSELNKIQKDEYLTQQEKDTQSIALLSELGISAKDYQYHEVAKETNDLKSLYVEEELVKMMAQNKSKDEIYAWLVDQRREVNGKMVLAPGVIDYLVDQNILSYSEGKKLKAVKVDKKGTKVKTSKAKKAKVPKLKKISIKAIKPPKVKIVKSASSKFKNPKVKKINIRRFNKVANRK
jgi:5-methylcytosine-specific restriction endonuclease McrA